MIQCQILQTNITRTTWQTVRRITNEILGVKGLRNDVSLLLSLIYLLLCSLTVVVYFQSSSIYPQHLPPVSYYFTARSFRPWPSVVHGLVVSHFHLQNRSWLNEPKEIQGKLLKNNILYSTAQRSNFLPGKHFYRRKEK